MIAPEVIAFPLKSERHEVRLDNLTDGLYIVCGEAVRSEVVLESQCFTAQVLLVDETATQLVNIGVGIVIALVAVLFLLALLYGFHYKIHRDRRKRMDQ